MRHPAQRAGHQDVVHPGRSAGQTLPRRVVRAPVPLIPGVGEFIDLHPLVQMHGDGRVRRDGRVGRDEPYRLVHRPAVCGPGVIPGHRMPGVRQRSPQPGADERTHQQQGHQRLPDMPVVEAEAADAQDGGDEHHGDHQGAVVVLDLILVGERAEAVVEKRSGHEHKSQRRQEREERDRREHLQVIPGAVGTEGLLHHPPRAGHEGLQEPAHAAERDPLPMAGQVGGQSAGSVEVRQHEPVAHEEPDGPQSGRGDADARPVADGHPDAEADDHERNVLLHHQEEHDAHEKASPAPAQHEPDGEEEKGDGEDIRMERFEVDVAQVRAHQVGKGDGRSEHLAAQLLARDEERRSRGKTEGQGLKDEQQLARGEQPEQRHEEQHDERQMVGEVLSAGDGEKGAVKPAEQPEPLVVDAEVVAAAPDGHVVGVVGEAPRCVDPQVRGDATEQDGSRHP